MTFYIIIEMDKGEVLHFKTEAESAHHAVRLAAAYCKGRFEGSGIGGQITAVSKTKARGVEYRGL